MSFFEVDDVWKDDLLHDLQKVIQQGSDNAARSLQRALGPSEVGHQCARHLAFAMMGEPKCNVGSDPLAALMGTAFHAWFSDAITLANQLLGRDRWITERKVEVRPGLPGTCDLYDRDTDTVVDLKCPGPTRYAKYKKEGPSRVYRRQVHLYGKGYERSFGITPKNVGIFFVPRAGRLSNAFLWTEPYQPELVEDTFLRLDSITELCAGLDVEHHPERYAMIPSTPSEDCDLCAWWNPTPSGPCQCPGTEQD